jgi:hypothetical protein
MQAMETEDKKQTGQKGAADIREHLAHLERLAEQLSFKYSIVHGQCA